MKTLRNISTVIAFAFILAGISGCSGCNPPPEPASFSPMEGPETGIPYTLPLFITLGQPSELRAISSI